MVPLHEAEQEDWALTAVDKIARAMADFIKFFKISFFFVIIEFMRVECECQKHLFFTKILRFII